MLKFPPPDLTIGEVADLEDREQGGEPLTPEQTEALAQARATFRPMVARFRPGMTALQRTVKAVSESIGATVAHWAEGYSDEFAYVDSLPPWKRKRYEHMTMPEVRRAMQRSASDQPARSAALARPARRDSHRTRPGHRRSGATSTTASADPGDPDPESSSGGLRHVSIPLAAELNRIADRLRTIGVA